MGSKAVLEKTLEVKTRRSGEITMVSEEKIEQTALEMLKEL